MAGQGRWHQQREAVQREGRSWTPVGPTVRVKRRPGQKGRKGPRRLLDGGGVGLPRGDRLLGSWMAPHTAAVPGGYPGAGTLE